MNPPGSLKRKAETADHPFRCDKCPGAFTRREHLARHQRTHENERPYACAFCAQRFGRKDLRDRHERNIHPEEAVPQVRNPADDGMVVAPSATSKSRGTSQTQIPSDMVRPLLRACFDLVKVDLYFIHEPTFDLDSHHPGLIRAMACTGGFVACRSEQQRQMIQAVYYEESLAVRKLLGSLKPDDRRTFDVLAEAVILCFVSAVHLNASMDTGARELFHEVVHFGRLAGLNRPLDTSGMRGGRRLSLRGEWTEWARAESWKRLHYIIVHLDNFVSYIWAQPRSLYLTELQHDLPDPLEMWEARTPEEWYAARKAVQDRKSFRAPLLDLFSDLTQKGTIPEDIDMLGLTLLAVVLAHLISQHVASQVLVLRFQRNAPGAGSHRGWLDQSEQTSLLRSTVLRLIERTQAYMHATGFDPDSTAPRRDNADTCFAQLMQLAIQLAAPDMRVIHGVCTASLTNDLKLGALMSWLAPVEETDRSAFAINSVCHTLESFIRVARICRITNPRHADGTLLSLEERTTLDLPRLSPDREFVNIHFGILLPLYLKIWQFARAVRMRLMSGQVGSEERAACVELDGAVARLRRFLDETQLPENEMRRLHAVASYRPPSWVQIDGRLAMFHQRATVAARAAETSSSNGNHSTSNGSAPHSAGTGAAIGAQGGVNGRANSESNNQAVGVTSAETLAFLARERVNEARLAVACERAHALPEHLRIRLEQLRVEQELANMLYRLTTSIGRDLLMSSFEIVQEQMSYMEGIALHRAECVLGELPEHVFHAIDDEAQSRIHRASAHKRHHTLPGQHLGAIPYHPYHQPNPKIHGMPHFPNFQPHPEYATADRERSRSHDRDSQYSSDGGRSINGHSNSNGQGALSHQQHHHHQPQGALPPAHPSHPAQQTSRSAYALPSPSDLFEGRRRGSIDDSTRHHPYPPQHPLAHPLTHSQSHNPGYHASSRPILPPLVSPSGRSSGSGSPPNGAVRGSNTGGGSSLAQYGVNGHSNHGGSPHRSPGTTSPPPSAHSQSVTGGHHAFGGPLPLPPASGLLASQRTGPSSEYPRSHHETGPHPSGSYYHQPHPPHHQQQGYRGPPSFGYHNQHPSAPQPQQQRGSPYLPPLQAAAPQGHSGPAAATHAPTRYSDGR
ncbi:hypothetical protein PYCC9005_005018 [Savitreella phatthalungensis]